MENAVLRESMRLECMIFHVARMCLRKHLPNGIMVFKCDSMITLCILSKLCTFLFGPRCWRSRISRSKHVKAIPSRCIHIQVGFIGIVSVAVRSRHELLLIGLRKVKKRITGRWSVGVSGSDDFS